MKGLTHNNQSSKNMFRKEEDIKISENIKYNFSKDELEDTIVISESFAKKLTGDTTDTIKLSGRRGNK